MRPFEQLPLDLPPALSDLRDRARTHYQAGRMKAALELDESLLREAEAQGNLAGRILGHRFVGLCCYRLGDLERSRDQLLQASALAHEAGLEHLELRVANHLGATLRRLGQLEEAHQIFRDSLRRAVLPAFVNERLRLLGNLGALLDESGDVEAASDCYARYEELCELTGDRHKLANARGLAGRAARQRGDHAEAEWRAHEELRLGRELQEGGREADGLLHLGKLRMDQADASALDPDRRFLLAAEGRGAMEEALQLAGRREDPARQVSILTSLAALERRHGTIAGAWQRVAQAMSVEGDRGPESRARLHRTAAEICQDAGLHGDALWHLTREVDLRCGLYEPLRDERLLRAVARRRAELGEALTTLTREAGAVDRSDEERARILDLVRRIQPEHRREDDETLWERLIASKERVPAWRLRIRTEAEARWRDRLIPGTWPRLTPESRRDLVLADVAYQGVVDDLARSVHLLLVVVERELKQRVWLPAAAGQADAERANLGEMLLSLKRSRRRDARPLEGLASVLGERRHRLDAVLGLLRTVHTLDGDSFKLVDTRNAVAHGDERLRGLTRARVDAARRRLALEVPVVLEVLVGFSLVRKKSG